MMIEAPVFTSFYHHQNLSLKSHYLLPFSEAVKLTEEIKMFTNNFYNFNERRDNYE